MVRVLKPGELEKKCRSCKARFAFGPADCFVRNAVCGMINSGTFAREPHIYRCPTCQKRVDVTGVVSVKAATGEDPLCKCVGNYCRCWRDES